MVGVSTDFVKQGTHADLGYGFTLPLIGLTLPDRDLTVVEKQRAEEMIKITYKEFVGKVASGRDMDYDAVETVAQGRVWSGADGLKNNLVDKLGGLSNAIDMAAQLVNLKKYEYKLVEYPAPRLFDISQFVPKLLGIELEKNKLIEHLKFRLTNNGIPMPIMPIENIDLMEMK
jgi:protease-4